MGLCLEKVLFINLSDLLIEILLNLLRIVNRRHVVCRTSSLGEWLPRRVAVLQRAPVGKDVSVECAREREGESAHVRV